MTLLRPLRLYLVVMIVLAFALASRIDADPYISRISSSPSSELAGGWHFVRTPNPRGNNEAVSIMHTADTSRSDLDFAGLMVRCREGGTEVVIVLLRPFPFRAKPMVVLGQSGHESQFKATVAPPGTAILLPGDAALFVGSTFGRLDDLFIRVADGQNTIQGVVPLEGLQAAFKVLVANCP